MLKNFTDLSKRIAAAKAAFVAEAQTLVKPVLQTFMQEHPNIKALGWAQYTPYFNDGDPCIFHLHGMHASATEDRDDDLHGDGWHEIYGDEPEDGFDKRDWIDINELEKALGGMEEELQSVFGDHVRVLVTARGVDVDEYEHD